MRSTIAAVISVALLMGAPGLSLAAGPYKLDDKGKCHDASGKFAKAENCKVAHIYKLDAKGKCRDEAGKFAKAALCKAG
ncbi:hypothetical protein [Phenylobacterium montanum]|uniref:Uncharacterized protein n=1 Tax=Phenylobacterium montanum TaxID=2823693 RepID=A0A975G458_9CAUL|nr:hypothetical protein [Caulobacter sp. S6]QUD90321.1 hypothetical protein KCG34_10875 [Caulobacter sp. S6]